MKKNYLANFYSFLTDRKITGKEQQQVPNIQKKFEVKTMEDYQGLYLECGALLLANAFEKFRNKS